MMHMARLSELMTLQAQEWIQKMHKKGNSPLVIASELGKHMETKVPEDFVRKHIDFTGDSKTFTQNKIGVKIRYELTPKLGMLLDKHREALGRQGLARHFGIPIRMVDEHLQKARKG